MTMINRLFSSFDPIRNITLTRYSALILPFLFLFYLYKINPRLSQTLQLHWNFLTREINISIPRSFTQGKTKFLFSIFLFVLLLNIVGLFPYTYTITAQITLTLRLAFCIWFAIIIFNLIKNTSRFLSHLVPLGTPLPLSQFITLIETVSQIIRPITLSVRLAANITAGHILIALCREPIVIANLFRPILIILFILEIAVAFIQAYVFITLLSMYLRETYDSISPLSHSIYKTLTYSNRNVHP